MGALMAARSAPARALAFFVADVGQVEAAAEQGFDVALRGGLFFGALHVFGDAGVAGEVAVDEGFGGQIVYAQRFGEAVLAHAVNEAEVDGFGVAALFGRDVFGGDTEHFGGGAACTSSPFWNAAMRVLSLERCAMMRSSIWE